MSIILRAPHKLCNFWATCRQQSTWWKLCSTTCEGIGCQFLLFDSLLVTSYLQVAYNLWKVALSTNVTSCQQLTILTTYSMVCHCILGNKNKWPYDNVYCMSKLVFPIDTNDCYWWLLGYYLICTNLGCRGGTTWNVCCDVTIRKWMIRDQKFLSTFLASFF